MAQYESGVNMTEFSESLQRKVDLDPCLRLMLFVEAMKMKDNDFDVFYKSRILDVQPYIEANRKYPFICDEIIRSIIVEYIDRANEFGVKVKFNPEEFSFLKDWNGIYLLMEDRDIYV